MTKQCSVPSCGRSARSGGMCNAHYARYRRSGTPIGAGQMMRDSVPTKCSIEGCTRPHATRGLCGTHYERQRRTGVLTARPMRKKGEGTLGGGYCTFVRHVDGKKVRIRRCRLVMERIIGRALLPNETVHHKNGNKVDDRPSNLELWATPHGKGQRIEDLVKYAREILKTYGQIEKKLKRRKDPDPSELLLF